MGSEHPVTISDLLARIDASWNTFQAYIATLTPAQMTGPTDAAGWTAKDHVAHLMLWERGLVDMLDGQNRREAMGLDEASWNGGDYTRINEDLRQQEADRPLDEIMQAYAEVHARFLARIAALADSDLARPYRDFERGSSNETPLVNYLAGDTYDHYVQHMPWIAAIVANG